MKIDYIADVRLPTERAHGLQITKMCAAFAAAGTDVRLIVPKKTSHASASDVFDYYGVKKNFEILFLPTFDLLGKTWRLGKILYWLDLGIFLGTLFLSGQTRKDAWLYARDPLLLLPFWSQRHRWCLEVHNLPHKKSLFLKILRRAHRIIVLTNLLKDDLVACGINPDQVIVAADAVDSEEFQVPVTQAEARQQLGLPSGKKIVLYSGHLYPWKGARVLAQAAVMNPEINFIFVGGVEPELTDFQNEYQHDSNITVLPFQAHTAIPYYLQAADVLVLPNSGNVPISTRYTSPLKLFEYMASGRPIVASQLPSIQEVLSDRNCFFARADDPDSFSRAIRTALENPDLAAAKASAALSDVKQYTWQQRAVSISNFMQL